VEKNKRAKSDKQIAQELVAWTKRNLPGVTVAVSEQTGNADSIAPVQIELLGQDRAPLIRLADQIRRRLSKIVEIRDIRSSWRPGRPELQIRVDREKAADWASRRAMPPAGCASLMRATPKPMTPT
jgi:HAE1 family hydrophobic/amphiphilic exporter-1